MDQSVSPNVFRKKTDIMIPWTRVYLLLWSIFRKDTDTWTRVCLLIYLEYTTDTVMPWTGVCLLE